MLFEVIFLVVFYLLVKYGPTFYKLSKLPKAPNSFLYGDIQELLSPPLGNCVEPLGIGKFNGINKLHLE